VVNGELAALVSGLAFASGAVLGFAIAVAYYKWQLHLALTALKVLYAYDEDYIQVNNLPGAEDNPAMRLAKATIAHVEGR
jgi:hypothetical protein